MDTIQQKTKQTTQNNNLSFTTLHLCKNLEKLDLIILPLQNINAKWDENNYSAINRGLTNLVTSIPSIKKSIVWLDYEGIILDVLLSKESDGSEIIQLGFDYFPNFNLTYKDIFFKDGTRYLRICFMVQTHSAE